jgi:hypothetical protein
MGCGRISQTTHHIAQQAVATTLLALLLGTEDESAAPNTETLYLLWKANQLQLRRLDPNSLSVIDEAGDRQCRPNVSATS